MNLTKVCLFERLGRGGACGLTAVGQQRAPVGAPIIVPQVNIRPGTATFVPIFALQHIQMCLNEDVEGNKEQLECEKTPFIGSWVSVGFYTFSTRVSGGRACRHPAGQASTCLLTTGRHKYVQMPPCPSDCLRRRQHGSTEAARRRL